MGLTAEKVEEEALRLPIASRAILTEKLLASLAGDADPTVERVHLDEIQRRRFALRAGETKLIDGDEALRQARAALRR